MADLCPSICAAENVNFHHSFSKRIFPLIFLLELKNPHVTRAWVTPHCRSSLLGRALSIHPLHHFLLAIPQPLHAVPPLNNFFLSIWASLRRVNTCLIQGLGAVAVCCSSVPGVLMRAVINRMECDANGESPVPGLEHTAATGAPFWHFPPLRMCQILGSALSVKPWLLSNTSGYFCHWCWEYLDNLDRPALGSYHGHPMQRLWEAFGQV